MNEKTGSIKMEFRNQEYAHDVRIRSKRVVFGNGQPSYSYDVLTCVCKEGDEDGAIGELTAIGQLSPNERLIMDFYYGSRDGNVTIRMRVFPSKDTLARYLFRNKRMLHSIKISGAGIIKEVIQEFLN